MRKVPLSEFAKQNHAIKRYSELFGEEYWLVPGPHVAVVPEAVYYVSEIQLLSRFKEYKAFLKAVHCIKKRFDATIIEVNPKSKDTRKPGHTVPKT